MSKRWKNNLWHFFQWISQLSQDKSKIIQPQCLPAFLKNYKTYDPQ
jgi:hypothetical protein